MAQPDPHRSLKEPRLCLSQRTSEARQAESFTGGGRFWVVAIGPLFWKNGLVYWTWGQLVGHATVVLIVRWFKLILISIPWLCLCLCLFLQKCGQGRNLEPPTFRCAGSQHRSRRGSDPATSSLSRTPATPSTVSWKPRYGSKMKPSSPKPRNCGNLYQGCRPVQLQSWGQWRSTTPDRRKAISRLRQQLCAPRIDGVCHGGRRCTTPGRLRSGPQRLVVRSTLPCTWLSGC